MTPNFALSLSFEGIALLRRMGPRWALIDDVPLDHDDFDSQVLNLRDQAERLDPTGAQVALIIPNEQIRYLDQLDLGGDEITRDTAIRASLDGATPYAVSDLNFDYVVSGGRLQVAAVANETLDEAQSFAREHGFEPVCFLAKAPDDSFDGPVFFGKAANWGRVVTRPARAIEIVPADAAALRPLPKPELANAPAPKPVKQPEPEPEPVVQDVPVVEKEPVVEEQGVEDQTGLDSALDALDSDASEPDDQISDVLAPKPIAHPKPTPQPEFHLKPDPAPAAQVQSTPPPAEKDAAQPDPGAPKAPAAPRAPIAPPAAPAAAKPLAAPSMDAPQVPRQPLVNPLAPPAAATPKTPELSQAAPPAAAPSGPGAESDRPPAFSTIRAGRSLPGGSAPALTGEFKPRFTPVSPRGSGMPEPADPTSADPKPSGKTGFFATPTASALLAQAAAAVDATEAAATTGPDGKPAAGAAPKRTELPPRLKARAKAPAKSGLKALPKTVAARAAGLAATPTRKPKTDEGIAPPVAAREAAPIAVPARKGPRPNPLAKLAALRGPRPNAEIGGPAFATGGAAAATASPGHAMFGSSEERDRMTVFGARDRDATRGKPRYLGLLLTALLLMFLLGVAAWASVFLDEGLARLFRSNDDAPASAVASLPDGADTGVVLESATPAVVSPPVVSLRPVARPAEDVRLAALDTPEVTDAPPVAPLSVPIDPRQLTSEEAAATYAATGIWQRSPVKPMTPPADGVEDIYAASIDPSIQIFDAVALPDAKELEREAALADPGLPPPAGLTFDFDQRDVVRATPEGALTPDGLRIFTGRPPVIPPLRGENTSAAPDPDAPDGAAPVPRVRPRARPSDIIQQRERSQLRGITRTELASIRPTMRPKTVQEQAELDTPDATEQAVVRSLVPVGRPRNMDAIVDRADRSIAPSPVQTAAVAVAPRTVAPSIPSSTSVARSATLENAINLKKINLIGVYGTSDNRRALVRLANGKYQKVKVGDRLDGGQVTAIGEDALRYSKGSRNLTLQMPSG
ncbi:hypothetical protein ANTHELSMS3_04048 [Antarctobacter heliothermus]|uniref:Type IV pilus biogenesis n=1 Tax=Antarctobacter heliothermus TaxID=74033 RepID=A0A222E8Y5_9RHOB|nr:hypothetical protein [Antarctobacter heliothermus]ASP22657.1 hypothetical protein ANTHELSMS3_04048 [Antarctobacter heliothermus]